MTASPRHRHRPSSWAARVATRSPSTSAKRQPRLRPGISCSATTVLLDYTRLTRISMPGADKNPAISTLVLSVDEGSGGNDTITTGTGSDLVIGGAGSDTITLGIGNKPGPG